MVWPWFPLRSDSRLCCSLPGAARTYHCAVVAILTISLILIAYGAVSGPLDRRGITSAMVLVAAGFAVGTSGLGWLHIGIESSAATSTIADVMPRRSRGPET